MNFVFMGCTRMAGSDYHMDTKFMTVSWHPAFDPRILSLNDMAHPPDA